MPLLGFKGENVSLFSLNREGEGKKMLQRSCVCFFYFRPLGGSAALQEAESVMKFKQADGYSRHQNDVIRHKKKLKNLRNLFKVCHTEFNQVFKIVFL